MYAALQETFIITSSLLTCDPCRARSTSRAVDAAEKPAEKPAEKAAEKAEKAEKEAEWKCVKCRVTNDGRFHKCSMCGEERPLKRAASTAQTGAPIRNPYNVRRT